MNKFRPRSMDCTYPSQCCPFCGAIVMFETSRKVAANGAGMTTYAHVGPHACIPVPMAME